MIKTPRDLHLAIGILSVVVGASRAHASIARLRLWVESGSATEYLVASSPTPTGNQKFNFTTVIDGLAITWDYAADLNPDGTAVINGSMTFQNLTLKTLAASAQFEAPLCPMVIADSRIGGVASVKLISNADGGKITCLSDDKDLDVATTGDAVTSPLFWCPFELSISGGGTATTSTTFGAPIPSMVGPQQVADLGHSVALTISPGDKGVLTLIYVAKGSFEKPSESSCVGDTNQDFVVDGGDLARVLDCYDSLATCDEPGDIDGDGLVNGADLATLLMCWGPCVSMKGW